MFTTSKTSEPILSKTSLARLAKLFAFAVVFGGLKLNALAAALLLSNFFVDAEAFGFFDFSLTIGILLALLFNAGLHAAIPYFLLKKKQPEYEATFYFHGILLISCFVTFLVLIRIFSVALSPLVHLSLLIGMLITLQTLSSVICKTKEKIYHAVVLDGSIFIGLSSYNLYLFLFDQSATIVDIQFILLALLAIHLLIYLKAFRQQFKFFSWSNYLQALKFGRSLVLGSFLILSLTASGRILVAQFFDMKSVGIYGLYFRLAAIVIMIHQVVNIAFFKQLYQGDAHQLDYWFEKFIWVISVISLISYLFLPAWLVPHLTLLTESCPTAKPLLLALHFQMIFWIALALFENVIHREQLTGVFNQGVLILLGGIGLCLFSISLLPCFSIELLVTINALAIFLAVEWQLKLLTRKGFKFIGTRRSLRIIAVACIVQFIII